MTGDPTDTPPDGKRRRRRATFAGFLLVLGLVSALLAYGLRHDPNAIASPLVGKRAPAFDLPLLAGPGRVTLAEWRGHPVLVNFWASWCTECRREAPVLGAAWSTFRDRGLVLVGVDFQDDEAAALAFALDQGMSWPLVTDPGSKTALSYGVYGIPETYLVGADGTVAAKWAGPVPYDDLVASIRRELRGPTS